jgi:hypothetical protein
MVKTAKKSFWQPLPVAVTSRLPVGDTADYQSAVPDKRILNAKSES